MTEMAKVLHDTKAADSFGEDSGYEPQLKRTLGSFQIFAVSFAFISVAVGIFSTYDDVLPERGAGRDMAVGHRSDRGRLWWHW